jgi:hypothetical protein
MVVSSADEKGVAEGRGKKWKAGLEIGGHINLGSGWLGTGPGHCSLSYSFLPTGNSPLSKCIFAVKVTFIRLCIKYLLSFYTN